MPPSITCTLVWLGSSIAAMSAGARLNPGNQQNNTPYLEDVQTGSGFSSDFDL